MKAEAGVSRPECPIDYFKRREASGTWSRWQRFELKKAETCHACKARTIWATGTRLSAEA